MIDISTNSYFYVFFLAASPFILRNSSKYRKYIFLVLNIVIYAASCKWLLQGVVFALWILVPWLCMRFLKADQRGRIKPVLITAMTAAFIYLSQYEVLKLFGGIIGFLPFKLLGLSYFLFRQIDYILQYEYLEESGLALDFVDYLNHVINFYTVLAGPILRYEEFIRDFYKEISPLSGDEILKHINRAVNGYLKVYLLSAFIKGRADFYFEGLGNHSSILLAVLAYCIFAFLNGWYIYLNFSGYCDIVIAFAALSGFEVHENFNQPYLARSVVEFWNRHHITLSEWIRDYIYSPLFKKFLSGPLGKNVQAAQCLALFITFTAAGIWHGTDFNYLIYGLLQGVGIVVATAFKTFRKKKWSKEKNKAFDNSLFITTFRRCVTWGYICLTFSFVGYDVIGLIR